MFSRSASASTNHIWRHMFSVTSLNDGEMRQYDGTLNEIWRTMLHRAPLLNAPEAFCDGKLAGRRG